MYSLSKGVRGVTKAFESSTLFPCYTILKEDTKYVSPGRGYKKKEPIKGSFLHTIRLSI